MSPAKVSQKIYMLYIVAYGMVTMRELRQNARWKEHVDKLTDPAVNSLFEEFLILPHEQEKVTDLVKNNFPVPDAVGNFVTMLQNNLNRMQRIHFFVLRRLIKKFKQLQSVFCYGMERANIVTAKTRLRWMVGVTVLDALESTYPEIMNYDLLDTGVHRATFLQQMASKTGSVMAESCESRILLPTLLYRVNKLEVDILTNIAKMPRAKRQMLVDRIGSVKEEVYSMLCRHRILFVYRQSLCQFWILAEFVDKEIRDTKAGDEMEENNEWKPESCASEEMVKKVIGEQRVAQAETTFTMVKQALIGDKIFADQLIAIPGVKTRIRKLLSDSDKFNELLQSTPLIKAQTAIDDSLLKFQYLEALCSSSDQLFQEAVIKTNGVAFIRWMDERLISAANDPGGQHQLARRIDQVWKKELRRVHVNIYDQIFDAVDEKEYEFVRVQMRSVFGVSRTFVDKMLTKNKLKNDKFIDREWMKLSQQKMVEILQMKGDGAEEKEEEFEKWMVNLHSEMMKKLISEKGEGGKAFREALKHGFEYDHAVFRLIGLVGSEEKAIEILNLVGFDAIEICKTKKEKENVKMKQNDDKKGKKKKRPKKNQKNDQNFLEMNNDNVITDEIKEAEETNQNMVMDNETSECDQINKAITEEQSSEKQHVLMEGTNKEKNRNTEWTNDDKRLVMDEKTKDHIRMGGTKEDDQKLMEETKDHNKIGGVKENDQKLMEEESRERENDQIFVMEEETKDHNKMGGAKGNDQELIVEEVTKDHDKMGGKGDDQELIIQKEIAKETEEDNQNTVTEETNGNNQRNNQNIQKITTEREKDNYQNNEKTEESKENDDQLMSVSMDGKSDTVEEAKENDKIIKEDDDINRITVLEDINSVRNGKKEFIQIMVSMNAENDKMEWQSNDGIEKVNVRNKNAHEKECIESKMEGEQVVDYSEIEGIKLGDFVDDIYLTLKYGELIGILIRNNGNNSISRISAAFIKLEKGTVEDGNENEAEEQLKKKKIRSLLWLLNVGIYTNEIGHLLEGIKDQNDQQIKDQKLREEWDRLKKIELGQHTEWAELETELYKLMNRILGANDYGDRGEGQTAREMREMRRKLHIKKLAKLTKGTTNPLLKHIMNESNKRMIKEAIFGKEANNDQIWEEIEKAEDKA